MTIIEEGLERKNIVEQHLETEQKEIFKKTLEEILEGLHGINGDLRPYAIDAIIKLGQSVEGLDISNIFFGSEESLVLYPLKHEVYVNNGTGLVSVHLQPREFSLLEYFMKNPGKVLTYEDIQQNVWGYDSPVSNDCVRDYIKLLRKKIGPNHIKNIRKFGYKCTIPNSNGSIVRVGHNETTEELVLFGIFKLDRKNYTLHKDNERVHLYPAEYRVLEKLVENHGMVLTRAQLARSYIPINESVLDTDVKCVKFHIYGLRVKLEDDARNPKYIETVRGIGYKFIAPVSSPTTQQLKAS